MSVIIRGLIVLFFAVVIVQLNRGLVSEAFGAAMITGFLTMYLKGMKGF